MNELKMRQEFEAWAKPHLIYGDDSEDVEGFRLEMESGYYVWTETQAAWEAWQASRAGLVIELPPAPSVPEDSEEGIDDSHMDAYYAATGMRHACAKFIEAAGLKVLP
ncbi:hypothetical protein ABQX22_13620 [Xanthomonas sp. WHRI 1810A]|uniref:hypothetical protein n=1 Tax=Xanthomonas sp. WHRI 1810A TaxID=3161565 RepID=UPI0032E8C519